MSQTGVAPETVGREGLMLPRVEWDDRYDPGHQFLLFFRKIWELNTQDPWYTQQVAGGRRKPYNHELVLPVTTTQPLTVIKGSLKLRDRGDVEYDLRRNRENQDWGHWSAAVSGHELHGVYVPPESIGQFVPLVEVGLTHKEGGSGHEHLSRYSIRQLGREIRNSDFDPEDSVSMEVNDWLRIRDAAHSDAIHQLLRGTIEFLS